MMDDSALRASEFLDGLAARVGTAGLTTDADTLEPHLTEWRGLYRGAALAMAAPASTAEAAAVVRWCASHAVGIVPQGGNTGLVGGAIAHSSPQGPQIVLSASRLNRIIDLDRDNYTLTAQAGCVLAQLQAAAAQSDRLFPLSLAAEGSCQLGGNISTNAGGINVLRYGNMRDLVLGLEVILPDGEVLNVLRGLRKDNTGYDLKQLFIGAEGSLGFITAATCKLFPLPRSRATAWLAVDSPAAAVQLYAAAQDGVGQALVAYELISRVALDLVVKGISGCRDPLAEAAPWYVLVELADSAPGAESRLTEFLAAQLSSGGLRDGVVAASDSQAQSLWRLRHNISEAQKLAGAGIKHDVSVPISRVAEFIERGTRVAHELVPGSLVVAFGHLGDGNIHFNLNQPPGMEREAFLACWAPVSERIHALAIELGGSFSAEHGVGALKIADLARYRGGAELALMRRIKRALDPHGIMNPGKLFAASD
jgi:FAD/FMN-containing dehydrogenase